jgi:hypothetical protein
MMVDRTAQHGRRAKTLEPLPVAYQWMTQREAPRPSLERTTNSNFIKHIGGGVNRASGAISARRRRQIYTNKQF